MHPRLPVFTNHLHAGHPEDIVYAYISLDDYQMGTSALEQSVGTRAVNLVKAEHSTELKMRYLDYPKATSLISYRGFKLALSMLDGNSLLVNCAIRSC